MTWRELPSAIIRRQFWITTTGVCDPAALATALANLGDDRVMFSVDYPYENSHEAAAFLARAPLPPELRRKIERDNAAQLLGLRGSVGQHH